jgi:hypothetical protein
MRKTNPLMSMFLILSLCLIFSTVALSAAAKSRVVLARDPGAINDRNQADVQKTARLFDWALLAMTGQKTAVDSWKTLGLRTEDVVAIKINSDNWTIGLRPHPELVTALCLSLQTVIPANHIIVYDNITENMKESNFAVNGAGSGVRYTGTDQGDGFDPQERLTRIITATATKIINLASLKCVDGDLLVSLLLKNHIGSLIPEDMPKCHKDPDFLASVCARPSIKGKTILNIINGLRGSFQRGVPWYWGGIIVGTDPVAVDTAAVGVINEKRILEKVAPLPIPEYLKIAEKKYGLGTTDPAKIEQVKIDL